MYVLSELDRKIELLLRPDDELPGCSIEYRDNLIKGIESAHDLVVKFKESNYKS